MFIMENVGNVFESDCTIIMHQANCFTTMGAGIAKEVKMRHPEAFEADVKFGIPRGSRERLGKHSFAWSPDQTRLIVNLYGQHRYGRDKKYTEEDKLFMSIEHAFLKILDLKQRRPDFRVKVGMPYKIGCNLAGGNWTVVSEGIENLAIKHGIPVYFYRLK